MVKKPKVRQEYFQELKDQILFWDRVIEYTKEDLKQARENRNGQMRALKSLQKRYDKQ